MVYALELSMQISKKYTWYTFQTWHPCLECIFDVNNEKQYGGYIEVRKFGDMSFSVRNNRAKDQD
jgi:hypothetical protein